MSQGYLVHLCDREAWSAAQAAGEYRPPSLEQEGFIHCSRPEQVRDVARRYYREVPGLLLLWIDPERLGPEVRWEPSGDELFPHIYGPLNLEAVIKVEPFS